MKSAPMRRPHPAAEPEPVSGRPRRCPGYWLSLGTCWELMAETYRPLPHVPRPTTAVRSRRAIVCSVLHARNTWDTVGKPRLHNFSRNGAASHRLAPAQKLTHRQDPDPRSGVEEDECSPTADELLKYIKDEGVEFVDVRFCDLPGVMQHFTVPVSSFDQRVLRRRPELRRLVDPRLPGDPRVRHAAVPGPDDGVPRPVPRREDAGRQLLHPRPAHRRGLQPRPAQHRHEGRGVPRARPASPTPRTSPPRPSSTSSTTCASRPSRTPATTTSTPSEGAWNTGRDEEGGNRGYKSRYKGGYFPVAAGRPLRRPARRDGHRARATPASTSSAPTTRSAPPARPRSTTASTRCSRPPTT